MTTDRINGKYHPADAPATEVRAPLTPEQNIVRASEFVARAELMLELTEEPGKKKFLEGEGSLSDLLEPSFERGILYCLASIARTQLAIATMQLPTHPTGQ